ncbi:SUMF1/EgtB/PvdO family nonheme iron enzyme, partial [Candidatus Pacearchaeota archaeon]|nr:SUMF1/EgtB/PvdO family nonheme iron enzyme [Candidatus Pacearchaeota archaeon]
WDGLNTPSDISTSDLTDDNTFVEVAGDTMTGNLNINANLTVDTSDFFVNSNTGNVGIGTSSPSYDLDVAGNININEGSAYMYDGVQGLKLAKGTDTFYANTFVGQNAGNSSSTKQTAVGYSAGRENTGISQTALGYYAGYQNTGNYQTALGHAAGYQNTGNYQTALGHVAGRENTGISQTALGYYAGYQNTGISQTALGHLAGYQNTGNYQTALGYLAGRENTGISQTALGYYAGYQNTGISQTALGHYAGYQNTGNYQTAVGYVAGHSNSGDRVIGIGYEATRNNTATADDVVAIGYQAGKDNTDANQFIIKQANVNSVPLIQGNFSSGNVGIGTTSPSRVLEVNGNVNLNNSLYVNNDGNVGIGTTSPQNKLNVVGDANMTGHCVAEGTMISVVEMPENSYFEVFEDSINEKFSNKKATKNQENTQKSKNSWLFSEQIRGMENYEIKQIPVEEVKSGDYVLSLNETSGKFEPAKVKELLDMGTKPIYQLTTESGKSINTTKKHPYLVKLYSESECEKYESDVWNEDFDEFDGEFCTRWISVGELREGMKIKIYEDNFSDNSFVEMARPVLNNLDSYVQREISLDKQRAMKSSSFACSFNNCFALESESLYLSNEMNLILLNISEDNRLKSSSESLDLDNISCLLLRNSCLSFNGANNCNLSLKMISNISPEEINVLNSTFASSTTFIYINPLFSRSDFIESLTLLDNSSTSCSVNLDLDTISFATDNSSSLVRDFIKLAKTNSNLSLNSAGMSNFILISSINNPKSEEYLSLSDVGFEKIVSIEKHSSNQVYDLAIEGTHNFVANEIVAHNTYVGGYLNATSDVCIDGGACLSSVGSSGANVTSSGSANYIPKFTSGSNIGNSVLYESGGNVGIGTTSPDNKLSVSGGADITGNLGIGTTSPLAGVAQTNVKTTNLTSHYGQLALIDDSAITDGIGGAMYFGGKYTGSTYTTWAGIQGAKAVATDGNYGGELRFFTRVQGANMGATGPRMVINNDGNVGIGTTSPGAKLHVDGSAIINGTLIGLSNATDLTGAVTLAQLQTINNTVSGDYVPYTGADSNIDLGDKNITTSGTGFFGFLGTVGSRITSLFVVDADIINNLGVGENLSVGGDLDVAGNLEVQGDVHVEGVVYSDKCPTGMAYINNLGGYCIDKYEASRPDATDSSMGSDTSYAVSQQGVIPWVSISQINSRTACENAGKHLCTDEEWLGAANVQGQVYYLPTNLAVSPYYCVTDSSTYCLDNSYSSGEACDTGTYSGGASGCYSAEGVYDMVGNVWEWTNETVDVTNPDGTVGWKYANQDGEWQSGTSGLWNKYGNDGVYFPTTTTGRAVRRGGRWYYGASAGPFCAHLDNAPTTTYYNIGFRCCF